MYNNFIIIIVPSRPRGSIVLYIKLECRYNYSTVSNVAADLDSLGSRILILIISPGIRRPLTSHAKTALHESPNHEECWTR